MERNIWFAHKRFVGEHYCARMTLGFFEIIPTINTNKTSPEKKYIFVYRRLMDILLCGISKTEDSTEPSGPPKAPRNSEHHSCLSGMPHDASARGAVLLQCSVVLWKPRWVVFPAVPNSHTSWGTKGLLACRSSVKLKWLTLTFFFVCRQFLQYFISLYVLFFLLCISLLA